MTNSNDPIIGIDLGTTNSLAAFVYPEGAMPIASGESTTFTPSAVSFSDRGMLIGRAAIDAAASFPEKTFFSFKRFMGRSLNDMQSELAYLPFTAVAGPSNTVVFPVDDRRISSEELSAEVLKHIRQKSEQLLQRPLKKAVITVPAYFNDVQRQATRNAALLAGLEPVRIINEPTAAAIAYGLDEKTKGRILVYDLGGGTFDVSILELKEKVFRVLATNGDTRLGGDDLDMIIAGHLRRVFQENTGSAFSDNPSSRRQLKQVAERLKITLSTANIAEAQLTDPASAKTADITLTREACHNLLEETIVSTLKRVEAALSDAGLAKTDIDDVVLVGGSTRSPSVRQILTDYFDRPLHTRINPDEVVAVGASILGHLLAGGRRDFLLMDVIPLSLGIETIGGSFAKMIMKNSSIPAKISETFSTSVDGQTGIEINVYQGEREMVKDCRLLGKIKLRGIPPMPAGFPRLEVTFTVDSNGILHVSANETRSGSAAEIEIIPEHGLRPMTVQKMIEDSLQYAEEDFTLRNAADFRVKAHMMIQGFGKIAADIKAMVPTDEFAAIQAAFTNLEATAKSDDPGAIKAAIDECGKLTAEVSDAVMSQKIKQALTREQP